MPNLLEPAAVNVLSSLTPRRRQDRLPALLAILLLCLALFAGLASPALAADTPPEVREVATRLDEARKKVEDIRSRLKENAADAQLRAWRADMLDIQRSASETAQLLAPKLASVEARLAELGPAPEGAAETSDVAAQRKQLGDDRSDLDAQIKLARLLSVNAGQSAEQISALRQAQFNAQMGERSQSLFADSFWQDLLSDLPRDWRKLAGLGDELAQALTQTPGIIWLGLAAAIALTLAVGIWLARLLLRMAATRVPPGRLRRSVHAVATTAVWTAIPTAIAALLRLGLGWNGQLSDAVAAFSSGFVATVALGGYMAGLSLALLSPRRPSWRLLSTPDAIASGLSRFPVALGAWWIVVWLVERLPALTHASLNTAIIGTSVAIVVLGLIPARAMRKASQLRARLTQQAGDTPIAPRPFIYWLLFRISAVVLWGSLICLLAGYVALASFAVKQLIWVQLILASAYLLCILTEDIVDALLGADGTEQEGTPHLRLRRQIAVLLSGVVRVSIGLVALLLMVAPVGEPPSELVQQATSFYGSISIGDIQVRPGAILHAIVVLLICLAGLRILKRWLTERYLPTTELDPGMQLSAATLLGYGGTVFAIALALSALGIGVERVAWIASALSVGIGFGLQAIVQNFVSGLILLAERPVKVGDWVSLSGVEGDIRRINVRATEIQMGDRSTVIVPNSEFVTKIVRNVTLDNPVGRVQVRMPIPLSADADTVRGVMQDAFAGNPDILADPAPAVQLDGIEGGSLMFVATGYVSSPRRVSGVRSALLFDILQRLKSAGIALGAPSQILVAGPDAPSLPRPGNPAPPLPKS